MHHPIRRRSERVHRCGIAGVERLLEATNLTVAAGRPRLGPWIPTRPVTAVP
jgi:hypothetical protein